MPKSPPSFKLGQSGKKTVANWPFNDDTYPNDGTALDRNQQMYENSQAWISWFVSVTTKAAAIQEANGSGHNERFESILFRGSANLHFTLLEPQADLRRTYQFLRRGGPSIDGNHDAQIRCCLRGSFIESAGCRPRNCPSGNTKQPPSPGLPLERSKTSNQRQNQTTINNSTKATQQIPNIIIGPVPVSPR